MHRGSAAPPPLYDPSTEHDACGVGFVADAGGASRDRVLPLALAGLASLGHRGAFAADGLSSDGAGVALPLEAPLVERLAARLPAAGRAAIRRRPAVLQLFLPRGRVRRMRAMATVEAALAEVALPATSWRTVPVDPSALGPAAFVARPAFAQLFVARPTAPGRRASSSPRPISDTAFERRLLLARRRIAGAAGAAGLPDLAVVSGSSRTIVYKGLVDGGRLAQLYPDLAGPLPLSFATFHQRYATNTHPTWRLAQPFGQLAHNGEINTVRGNREELRGRRGDPDPGGLLAEIAGRGPLLSADGSDSASLDEAVELLVASGWSVAGALEALIPEAPALRGEAAPSVAARARRTAGFLAPWDGPAALVFTDGRSVGALLDRNGLRPLAYSITRTGIVAAASEAGAVPLEPGEIETLARLGPGEMLLVEPGRRRIHVDAAGSREPARSSLTHDRPRPAFADELPRSIAGLGTPDPTPGRRYLAGLDAERLRLDLRTMTLDGHEPLWSMGDDTPTPGHGRVQRRAADHLKQSFAQVTNPPIDPERERLVVDLRVHVGRRAPLLGGVPRSARSIRASRPIVADLGGLVAGFHRLRAGTVLRLDATWPGPAGPGGLEAALAGLAAGAVAAARAGAALILLSDRAFDLERLPIPSVLAAGAVHAALTEAGLRGRTDIVVDAADVLDVHALAMVLAAGARAVHPWLAIRLAAEVAGTRGAEELSVSGAVGNLLDAFEAGLRKTLARMGISALASYAGGAFFETLDLAPEVGARCFPAALGWQGRVGFRDLAARQLARRDAATLLDGSAGAGHAAGLGADAATTAESSADSRAATPAGLAATPAGLAATPAHVREPRLPDPGLARFRADGELHLFAPRVIGAIQGLAGTDPVTGGDLPAYRAALERAAPAVVRDRLEVRPSVRRRAIPLEEVEPARAIVRRLVVSAMSVGALSPEAHQVLTIGIQRAGGAANTGEGGEDPAWYVPGADGRRHDAAIKQVASGRFGVTATYLARAEQLEIKIAQGSKPGEGGQLPARKATAYIAALRRGQAGQAYISPPPHHDIYSIEDLAQLIADLRAINPAARIGVKLVASRGVGTIAAGVAKAGADYIHLAGGAGGTGASPLSSIKHVGVPWELGLSEVHQVLLWNGLRDRVALRTDGGLQRGRDLLVAALLGAEEFALGTAALVAIGCDMARQCHLDTCPTGIATQRADLRAKFAGTPEQVERFALALAEDLRAELAAIGARSVGEIVGEAAATLRPARDSAPDEGLRRVLGAPRWAAGAGRRAAPASAGRELSRLASSPLETRLAAALRGHGAIRLDGLRISTAERSFGAALTGEVERGTIRVPVTLGLRGAAGQSFGAFLGTGLELRLEGTANDYVAKGLSGGTVIVRPDAEQRRNTEGGPGTDGGRGTGGGRGTEGGRGPALAGNTCLYGATAGRLHVVGRAGMRFAVRNAGADAVVEGIGPHGAEYMTGGMLLVLGPVGPNFGAGMTGGRAWVLDPAGAVRGRVDAASVTVRSLRDAIQPADAIEIGRLLRLHRDAGSALAAGLLANEASALRDFWAVEPRPVATEAAAIEEPAAPTTPRRDLAAVTGTQPIRPSPVIAAGA